MSEMPEIGQWWIIALLASESNFEVKAINCCSQRDTCPALWLPANYRLLKQFQELRGALPTLFVCSCHCTSSGTTNRCFLVWFALLVVM